MKKSISLMLMGFLLGFGAPLGALLLRALQSGLPLPWFFFEEIPSFAFFYSYMLVGTCLAFGFFGYLVGKEEDLVLKKDTALSKEVLTDPLTGLGNHRFLHDVFKVEFRRHVKSRQPISCIMMDLDHFKHVNDAHGHPFGDFVLKQFANLIKRSIREGDLAARYGGEEFLCILPHCDTDQVRAVAERIRRDTQRHLFSHGPKRVRLTVSLGSITSYESSGLNYRQLIGLSDQALYEAKKRGRNQLIQASLGKKLNK